MGHQPALHVARATPVAHADDVRPVLAGGLLADVVEVRCHLLRRRLPRIHSETALPEGALDDLLHRAFLPRDRGDADEILQQPHRVTAPSLDRTADLPYKLGVDSPHDCTSPLVLTWVTRHRTTVPGARQRVPA